MVTTNAKDYTFLSENKTQRMPYTKPGAEKGILRTESHRRRGYYACVRHEGKSIRKLFSNNKYGGAEEAFQAAINWRNKTENELGIIRTNRRLDLKRGCTDTGIAGVRQVKSGYQITASATIPIDECYPEQKALKRAIKLRNCLLDAQEMPGAKTEVEKGIHRVEREKGARGYYAHVRHDGKDLWKLFSDSKSQSPEGSYQAAIKWRNKTERILGIVRTNRRIDVRTPSTKTRIAGIRRIKSGYQVNIKVTVYTETQGSETETQSSALKLRKRFLAICAEFA